MTDINPNACYKCGALGHRARDVRSSCLSHTPHGPHLQQISVRMRIQNQIAMHVSLAINRATLLTSVRKSTSTILTFEWATGSVRDVAT